MASVTEAELAGLLTYIRTSLAEIIHVNSPIPVPTDNTAANSIVNETEEKKRSQAIDMRLY